MDLVEYPIQDRVYLEVYWRDDRAGYGPAASVYAYTTRKSCVWTVLERPRSRAERATAT
jgi:hypothetical protein